MTFASIIHSLFVLFQCTDCSGGIGPTCLPCCLPTNTCGGPPPPIGAPIDDYIIFLFIVALVYGLYVIKKMKSKLN